MDKIQSLSRSNYSWNNFDKMKMKFASCTSIMQMALSPPLQKLMYAMQRLAVPTCDSGGGCDIIT